MFLKCVDAVTYVFPVIPGITTDYAATPLSCNRTQFFGVESFVGGTSDGTVGAAAMRYTNPYRDTLSFQKAWFFLDDDVQHIMISSVESNSSAAHPVISVLDQKRLNGPVYLDGAPLTQGGNFSRPQSLWHDNVGYTFDYASSDHACDLAVDFGTRSGTWAKIGISTAGQTTVDLFSAWINHGSSPHLDVPIAYTAFPATSQDDFACKSAKARQDLQTIRNDEQVSAVFDGAHRTVMVVFWGAQGGSVTFTPGSSEASITVATPRNSVVIYKLDKRTVTVADPSQSLSKLSVKLIVGSTGRRPKGWGRQLQKTLSFVLPAGGIAGKSVTQML